MVVLSWFSHFPSSPLNPSPNFERQLYLHHKWVTNCILFVKDRLFPLCFFRFRTNFDIVQVAWFRQNNFRINLYIHYAWNLLTNWYIHVCLCTLKLMSVCLIYRLHNSAGYFEKKRDILYMNHSEFLPIKIRSHWASASVSASMLASMMTLQLMFQAIYYKN